MTRCVNWAQLLSAYLLERKAQPFAWVKNDCCTFAAGAVVAMTGRDPMAPLRGKYKTRAGAGKLLARAGNLQALASQYLGSPLATPALAMRGDVVLFDMGGPHGQALGICTGTHFAAPGPERTELVPMCAAVTAWRV
ncbi:MAG: hypothetical protein V4718_00530 [Pseudomonadota bacterium]